MRRLLVTGGRGQLGRGIVRRAAANQCTVIALGRDELDVTVPSSIAAAIDTHAPDAIIHAASFTAVDRAESERDAAHAVNTVGTENVARACNQQSLPLIYLSTDYVFDGRSTRPYREDDATAPLNVYGVTKLAGERAALATGTVLRTAWLFGDGGPSFVHAIAKRAREQNTLRVVSDQVGNPTYVDDLADALLQLRDARGEILHVCGDEPVSRHAFAEAIVDELRTITNVACEQIEAVTSDAFPTPARRPAFAPLDTSNAVARGLPIRNWRVGLRALLAAEFAR